VAEWAGWAGRACRVLTSRFWDGRRALFRVAAGRRFRPGPPHWHYWWQAHALDAVVDAADRAGAPPGPATVSAHVGGILRRNGGRIGNDYHDDMAWMALALLRAAERGSDTDALVSELWRHIKAGWDEKHRGIVWRRNDTYTNTPANAPTAVLAARLYRRGRDPTDLGWARAIDDWLQETMVDPDTGLVWDGIHPDTDPGPSRELYTYNQGTVIGVGVELHRVTGDVDHLVRAARTAQAVVDRFVRPEDGLLPDEGSGDGGLFKGILVRYLGEFVLAGSALPAEAPAADVGRVVNEVVDMLRKNGAAVVASGGDRPVGPDWANPARHAGSLSTHLSAVLLLETLARLEAAGVVAGSPAVPP
jgi:predicted alpha-1,6-mannanase (GH76 family)